MSPAQPVFLRTRLALAAVVLIGLAAAVLFFTQHVLTHSGLPVATPARLAELERRIWELGLFIGGLLFAFAGLLLWLGPRLSRPFVALQRSLESLGKEGITDDATGSAIASQMRYGEFSVLEEKIRHMAQQVQDGQAFKRAIFAATHNGLAILDDASRILQTNDGLLRMLHAERGDLLGQLLETLFEHGSQPPADIQAIARRSTPRVRWLWLHEQISEGLEHAPFATLWLDHMGHILGANTVCCRWMGASADSLRAREVDFMLPYWHRALREDGTHSKLTMLGLQGKVRRVEVAPIHLVGGDYLLFLFDAEEMPWARLCETAFVRCLEPDAPIHEDDFDRLLLWIQRVAQQHAEEGLLENDAFVQLLSEAPVACLLIGQEARVLFANPEAQKLTGYAPVELNGLPLEALLPPALRAGHADLVTGFMREPNARRMSRGRRLPLLRKDGQEMGVNVGLSSITLGQGGDAAAGRMVIVWLRSENDLPWAVIRHTAFGRAFAYDQQPPRLCVHGEDESMPVQVDASVVRGESQPLVVVGIQDISELHAKNTALFQQHQMHKRTLHAMQDGVLILDAEGRVRKLNPMAQRILGRGRNELLDEPFSHFVKATETPRKSFPVNDLQNRINRDPDGFWLWLWDCSLPVLAFAERDSVALANPAAEYVLQQPVGSSLSWRRMEGHLDAAECSLLQSGIQELLDGVGSDDVFPFVWRLSEGEPLPLYLHITLLRFYGAPVVVGILDEADGRASAADQERRITHPDGKTLPVLMTQAPIREQDGQVSGFVVTLKDISELAAMKERERLQAQNTNQARLAVLGEMATGLMHEINQPLTYISATLQTLRRAQRKGTPLAEEKCVEMYDESLRQVGRMSKIMQYLRDFGRGEKIGAMQSVLLNETLGRVLTLIGKRLELAGIQLDANIDPDLPAIQGDEAALEQVLVNLFLNAVDALEGRADKRLEIRIEALPEVVEIVVSDNGHGMSDEVRAHCCEPFFTTRPIGSGAVGVGLSSVHGIVSRHHGSIRVESAPEQGARFYIRLPLQLNPEN